MILLATLKQHPTLMVKELMICTRKTKPHKALSNLIYTNPKMTIDA